MKKLIFKLTLSLFLINAIFIGCETFSEKADSTKNNVVEAKEEFLADIENFKADTADKIEANKQNIEALKARIEYAKKDVKAYSLKKIAILEQKNSEMKVKLDEYKEDGKDNWEIFKAEFSRDMDDLGKSFKNFTVKNV
jgi:preprotein translocase subunit SecF